MELEQDYWKLVESIWDDIDIFADPATFLNQFQQVRSELRLLFAAHWCQSEIRNGGFWQFFWNSTGVLAPEAVEGFRAIGMPEVARVVAQSISYFGSSYPRAREERMKALPDIEELDDFEIGYPFSQLDDRFFELINSENNGFDESANQYASSISKEI